MHIYIPVFEDFCKKDQLDGAIISVKIGKYNLKLKALTSIKNQEKGYMYEPNSPSESEGLLFIYSTPIILTFWMKNVKFPLDIIFFDKERKYINYHEMQAQQFDSDRNLIRYSSSSPAQYAVELRSGWCKKFLDLDNCNLII